MMRGVAELSVTSTSFKGQALLEGAHPAEAIAPLRRAVELAPNPALIQILLSQALVATQ